jgi:NADH:ubiquinone oxidoreductase subunit 4 (subunit M)
MPLLLPKHGLAQFYTYISLVRVTYVFMLLPLFSTYIIVRLKFFALDRIGLILVYVTILVMLTSFYSHTFSPLNVSQALLVFLALTVSSFVVFTSGNILLLYVSYEASLVPISYLIIK